MTGPVIGQVIGPACQAEPLDLRPGLASTALFPMSAWRSAWREATFRHPELVPAADLGLAELREEIAAHVLRTRGIRLGDRVVVVTGGTAPGLRLVLDALGLRGNQVAVEEPADPVLRRAAGGYPAVPVAVAVDDDGVRVDTVAPTCRALVVSSDAGTTLGRVMSGDRRGQVADWAARTGALVIDVAGDPLPPARARRYPRLLDKLGDSAVLLGGVCGSLGPALGIGYAIMPRYLAGVVGQFIADRAEQPSGVAQRTMAALLRDGTVHRLARRVERHCAERNAVVESALARLGTVRYDGLDATGTALLHLPRHADAGRVAADLLARGLRVSTLGAYHFSGRPVRPALLFGYAHLSEADLHRSLVTLRATVAPLGQPVWDLAR